MTSVFVGLSWWTALVILNHIVLCLARCSHWDPPQRNGQWLNPALFRKKRNADAGATPMQQKKKMTNMTHFQPFSRWWNPAVSTIDHPMVFPADSLRSPVNCLPRWSCDNCYKPFPGDVWQDPVEAVLLRQICRFMEGTQCRISSNKWFWVDWYSKGFWKISITADLGRSWSVPGWCRSWSVGREDV